MRTSLLALFGEVLLIVAAAMVSVPAGVAVAGVECVVTAYVIRYLEARREAT